MSVNEPESKPPAARFSGGRFASGLPGSIEAYLEGDPWPPGAEGKEDAVEALWFHEFRSSRAELWPFLSDTSRLNERLGLAVMRFEEREGMLHGETGRGLFRQEWVELPWQWETAKSLSAERHYERGFARAVRVRFRLADHGDGGCRLLVYVGWIPRNWWGRIVLAIINRWLRRQYSRVMGGIDAEVAAGRAVLKMQRDERAAGVESTVNERRLLRGVGELGSKGFEHEELELFAGYLRGASDRELHRIRPKVLAAELGGEPAPLLRLLLHATRAGLLRLSWDVVCPHCRGVRREVSSLGSLREYERCDVCEIDFSATETEAIEVAFRVHPEVREVGEVFYCSAEPAKKPHIWLQRELEGGEQWGSRLDVAPGRYRLRSVGGGEGGALVFDVRRADGKTHVEEIRREGLGGLENRPMLEVEVGEGFLVRNPGQEALMIVLEDASPDREALRPSELFNFQEFRDLFSEESIAPGLGLEVGHQTLLFTDIVGSSQLYSDLGDGEAFKVVRDHFVALHDEVSSAGGGVVKTIGDAMMASFSRPEDALKAAASIQRHFCPSGDARVNLRISIHRGVCIAVKLDAGIDYFGHTVNRAAKIQAVAGAGEIAVSEAFYTVAGIPRLCREVGLEIEEVDLECQTRSGEERLFRGRLLA